MPTPTYDFTQDYPVRNAAGEIITAKPFPNYTATAAPVKIASPQMPSVVVVGVPFRIVPGSYRDATAISAPTLVNLTRQPDGLYVANAPGTVSYSETPSNGVGAMPAQTTSGTAVANLSRLEIKTPASVSPATVSVRESVTLSVGVVQGEVRREVSLVHNGVERRNEITGGVWQPGVAGSGYFSVKSFDKDGNSTEQRIAYNVATATATVPVSPNVTTQPSISGNATTGSVLTLNRGAASGTPAPTGTIQWLRGTTAISGATGTTYTLVSGDVGQAVSARVTWTNSAGSVQATSNAITGQATAPTNTAPTLAALPSQTWTVGTAVNVNLASYGADAQGAITFTATRLPAGVSISATGLLTGTPTAVASSSATITVTDTGGLTAQQPLAYTVQAAAPTQTAPTITTQPTISGGTAVGDILTLARGAATGNPTPTATYQWLRNGAVLSGEDALTLDTGGYNAGAYRARVRWSNGVNPDATGTSNTITVEAAVTPPSGIDYSRALVYFDANTPFTGSATDVTAITSRGTAGLSLAKTGTAAIQRTANGFVFADTGYVGAAGIAAGAATDGMFLVVEFTQNAVGSNWARLSDGVGSRMRLQIHAGNQSIIGTGADDTNVNIALGTAAFGTRHIVAFAMDDVLNQVTGYDASGASVGPIAHAGLTDPVNTRIDIGQYLNGTIHRWCLVGRTEGGAWPLTMAAVVADFRAGA